MEKHQPEKVFDTSLSASEDLACKSVVSTGSSHEQVDGVTFSASDQRMHASETVDGISERSSMLPQIFSHSIRDTRRFEEASTEKQPTEIDREEVTLSASKKTLQQRNSPFDEGEMFVSIDDRTEQEDQAGAMGENDTERPRVLRNQTCADQVEGIDARDKKLVTGHPKEMLSKRSVDNLKMADGCRIKLEPCTNSGDEAAIGGQAEKYLDDRDPATLMQEAVAKQLQQEAAKAMQQAINVEKAKMAAAEMVTQGAASQGGRRVKKGGQKRRHGERFDIEREEAFAENERGHTKNATLGLEKTYAEAMEQDHGITQSPTPMIPKTRRATRKPQFTQRVWRLDIVGEAFSRWRRIGASQEMRTDTEIAIYLMEHYENTLAGFQTVARCTTCQSPFSLTCATCRPARRSGKVLRQRLSIAPSPPADDDDDNSNDDESYLPSSQRTRIQPRRTSVTPTVAAVDGGDDFDCDTEEELMEDKESLDKTLDEDYQVPTASLQLKPHQKINIKQRRQQKQQQKRLKKQQPQKRQQLREKQQQKKVQKEVQAQEESAGEQQQTNEDSSDTPDKELALQPPLIPSRPRRGRKRKNAKAITKHVCQECGTTFSRSGGLKVHMRIHTGEKPYSCTQCGKSFNQTVSLIVHMRKHNNERPFVCTECNAAFPLASTLKQHVRIHTGEKPFSCDVCHRAFSRSGDLTSHMRSHTGAKPFLCTECGKSFGSSSDLTKHKRVHSGEKPYGCPECGKFFPFPHRLTAHMRSHTGDRPFLCQLCGAAFARASNLTVHTRIHTGHKPFKCEDCGKAFSDSGNLCKHRRSNHGGTGRKPDRSKVPENDASQMPTGGVSSSQPTIFNKNFSGGAVFPHGNKNASMFSRETNSKLEFVSRLNVDANPTLVENDSTANSHSREPTPSTSYISDSGQLGRGANLFPDRDGQAAKALPPGVGAEHPHSSSPHTPVFKCEECPATFQDAGMLAKHVHASHSVEKSYVPDANIEQFRASAAAYPDLRGAGEEGAAIFPYYNTLNYYYQQ